MHLLGIARTLLRGPMQHAVHAGHATLTLRQQLRCRTSRSIHATTEKCAVIIDHDRSSGVRVLPRFEPRRRLYLMQPFLYIACSSGARACSFRPKPASIARMVDVQRQSCLPVRFVTFRKCAGMLPTIPAPNNAKSWSLRNPPGVSPRKLLLRRRNRRPLGKRFSNLAECREINGHN